MSRIVQLGGATAFLLIVSVSVFAGEIASSGTNASSSAERSAKDAEFIASEQERLAGHPDLLAEFWTRLAIQSYNANNFSLALDYFSKAENGATKDLLQAAALYKAEIALRTDGKNGAADGAKILSDCVTKTRLATGDTLFGKIRVSQARFAGLAQDWKNCETFADAAITSGKDAEAKKTAVYWKALSQFQTEKYSKACRTIESNKDALSGDTALSLLYAKALIKAGRSADADAVFADLARSGSMDNAARLDYARTLLNSGRLSAAGEQASLASGAEALYLQGLSAFNQRNWESAVKLMQTSLRETPALEEKYAAYAWFYCGYAQYRTGDYSSAFSTLSSFVNENKTHPLRYDALMTASRSAVQSGQYEKSFAFAEQAIYASSTDEQQNEAVLLTAGIYADAGRYDKALSVLKPYISSRNQFAYQCRYEMARIQAFQKNFDAADRTYASLATEKPAGTFAEEAAYRRGELQYSQEKYAQAATLFEQYTQKWNSGQFFDAALYFCADSLAKSNQTDKAILYFMQVDNLRQSTYKYNAEKNLVELYEKQGDYANALQYAEKMLSGYGDQARDDGIAKKIDDLNELNAGADVTLIKKEKEYQNAGKDSTANGRAAGTELAALYVSHSDTKAKGIALAEKLLPKQTSPAESRYAAQNALLLAQHYRTNGENKKAAEAYLSAAQYSRAAGNDENAARALYGATEAFDAAGLDGDAKSTAESLASLYPKSSLVNSARQIVNK